MRFRVHGVRFGTVQFKEVSNTYDDVEANRFTVDQAGILWFWGDAPGTHHAVRAYKLWGNVEVLNENIDDDEGTAGVRQVDGGQEVGC